MEASRDRGEEPVQGGAISQSGGHPESVSASGDSYRRHFERTPNGIADLEVLRDAGGRSCDSRFLSVNPAFESLTGFRAGQLLGRAIREVIPGLDPLWLDACDRVARTGEPARFEIRLGSTGRDFAVTAYRIDRDRVTIVLNDITEQRQAQEALRTSEAQLSNALRMAHAGHWEYDVASDTFTFNDNFYRIFRTTAEAVGGYTMSSADYARRFCHPDDLGVVRAEIQGALEATDPGYSRQLEHRILYADGEVGHIAVRIFIVKDAGGCTVKTYGVNQDITERKRAEAIVCVERDLGLALAATSDLEEGLRLCLDAALRASGMDSGGIYVTDAAGEAMDLVMHRGLSAASVRSVSHMKMDSIRAQLLRTGVPLLLAWPPVVGDPSHLAIDPIRVDALRSEGLKCVMVVPVSANNTLVATLNVASHVREAVSPAELHALEVVAAHLGGILARLKAEHAIQANARRLEEEVSRRTLEIRWSEARYRALFERVDHAILVTDPGGRILSCNPAAHRLLGAAEAEMDGKPLGAWLVRPDRTEICESLLAIALERGSWTQECDIENVEGRVFPVSILVSPVREEGGDPRGVIWIVMDLSDKERLAEEARRAQDYAQAVLRSVGPTGQIVGRGPAFQAIVRFVQESAKVTSPVLILGESGTGKEVVARAIHLNGPRSEKPFVIVDCAALQAALLESELFGYEKGAFTGAAEAKMGLVEVADGGTLFVDEIGEMPLELQAKLLRVLERGEFRRLGSVKNRRVDLRVLSATNRDLSGEVAKGRFRSDLFFRINVLSAVLPPLRERREDIPLLAQHFLEHCRVTMSGTKRLSPRTLACLENYGWPGNVRELANVVERAVILSGSGDTIAPDHLPPEIRRTSHRKTPPLASIRIRDAEREAIQNALRVAQGNKSRAAELLGISRPTLRLKMARYGLIAQPDRKPRPPEASP